MKLNIDCVRDVMLWVEAITTPTQLASYVNTDAVDSDDGFLYINADDRPMPNAAQKKLLEKYSNETLVYHLHYCIEAKLLTEFDSPDGNIIVIKDLTPLGHDFIGNIRHDPVFQKVKTVLNLLGVKSLEAATQASSLVVTEIIKKAIS
ncbi:DUF2513 domain-containing protein [Phascolarctobacterium succinatutens]|uniref:DUF2513 domain-containing protein n=1 Tax=Phascolarctobacterium succinatutens TaxID=626940 RepID=UPI0030808917